MKRIPLFLEEPELREASKSSECSRAIQNACMHLGRQESHYPPIILLFQLLLPCLHLLRKEGVSGWKSRLHVWTREHAQLRLVDVVVEPPPHTNISSKWKLEEFWKLGKILFQSEKVRCLKLVV